MCMILHRKKSQEIIKIMSTYKQSIRKKATQLTIIFISLFFVLCKSKIKTIDTLNGLDTAIKVNNDTPNIIVLQTLDTTIILSKLEKSNYKGKKLTNMMAKKILYNHFTNKGYYTSDNLPDMSNLSEQDAQKLSVHFDTTYITELNSNKNEDAIITYWLMPPFASGHCWQPHKAIILDTDKGYKIVNEEFIPENFAIDSVVNNNGQLIVYGYDYDCANHKVLRNLIMHIK